MIRMLLLAGALAVPALQTAAQNSSEPGARQAEVSVGVGAVLRGLDKVNGHVEDLTIPIGGTANIQGLMVTVTDCRYPVNNPTGDAFAYLQVRNPQDGQTFFEGWMVASSPGLNALDHKRYDVWVMRCRIS